MTGRNLLSAGARRRRPATLSRRQPTRLHLEELESRLAPAVVSGTVFEDVNYGGGPGRTLAASSGVGIQGATVELYDSTGAFLQSVVTVGAGGYSFSGLQGNAYRVNGQLKLLWLGMGKEDAGVRAKRELSEALKGMNVKHEYHETDGAHRWSVWRLYLAEFLPRLFH